MTRRPLLDGDLQRPFKRQCLAVRAADGFNKPITPRRPPTSKHSTEFSGNTESASSCSRASSKKPPSVTRPPHVVSSSKANAENIQVITPNRKRTTASQLRSGLSTPQTKKPERRVLAAPIPADSNARPPEINLIAAIPPPLHLNVEVKPQKPLKPVQAPAFQPPKNAVVGQDLIAISNTKLGRLNHISSENGGEDLAAMLLDAVPAVHISRAANEDDAFRGLQMSPEKKAKGDTHKLVRGGLAGQALQFFNQSHTNLVLWHKEIDHRTTSKPDITVRVEEILVEPRQLSSCKTSSAVALCRVTQQRATGSSALRHDELHRFVLPFVHSSHSPHRFAVGTIVHVHRPWQEIRPQTEAGPSEDQRRRPASLPLPMSLPSTPESLNTNPTTLLCSRFLLI